MVFKKILKDVGLVALFLSGSCSVFGIGCNGLTYLSEWYGSRGGSCRELELRIDFYRKDEEKISGFLFGAYGYRKALEQQYLMKCKNSNY